MITSFRPIVAALLVAGLAGTGTASAVTRLRQDLVTPAGVCVPNVPTTAARYTVAGLKNAGTTNFYVTCSLKNDWHGAVPSTPGTGTTLTYLFFRNSSSTTANIRCTLYPGYSYDGSAVSGGSFPKSMNLAVGGQSSITWDPAVIGGSGTKFPNVNFSCSLPPNVIITFVFEAYDEDVGA